MSKIKIDGEWMQVESAHNYGVGIEIVTESGDFLLFPDSEAAGDAAKDRWLDLKVHDPKEFRCLIGDETLIAWACGEPGGPGIAKVCSFKEWLDVVAAHPWEEFASYDGEQRDVDGISSGAMAMLREAGIGGDVPTVAYRTN